MFGFPNFAAPDILFKIVSVEHCHLFCFSCSSVEENTFVVLVIFGDKVAKKLEKGISEPQLHKVSDYAPIHISWCCFH